ncbi:MAG: hypothetical protein L0H94_12605 [Nitrospira sp.]|nr:hypothetical protein [Nitrospira sp.]
MDATFQIGRHASNHLKVTVLRRCYLDCTDYDDGNWVDARVEIAAGGFRGRYRAYLRTEEFFGFQNEIAKLYYSLKGEACFDSMEDWLSIKVKGDGLGHMTADCKAMDEAGTGNTLCFELRFDQSDMPEILSGLAEIVDKFPVIGVEEKEK